MKKKNYILLALMISLLCMDKVNAACTKELEKEYLDIKKQYKIATTFNSKDKTYTARIERANTDKFKYSTTITAEYKCKKISETVTECYGLKPGVSFYAYVLGNTKECDTMLNKEEIYLKNYNKYYGDPMCAGIEEFVLCQEIYDRDIDRETFEYRINLYKQDKELELEEEEKIKQQENNIINKILTYVKENINETIIIVMFIILVVMSSIVGYKTIRKSRRLE